jgi:hypothetical protein
VNILFTSLTGHDRTQSQHYVRCLERLGHRVFRFGFPGLVSGPDDGAYIEPGFGPEITLEGIEEAAGFQPDLLLYIDPQGLIPRGIERAAYPTACILCDTHLRLDVRLLVARFFDHVFLYHRNYLRHFVEHPPARVHWHPYACDLELFHPCGPQRDLDVGFIGQWHLHPARAKVLSTVAERFSMNEQRYYRQSEIPSVYARAKIVVNDPARDDLNFRTFEAMSCGALLLTRRVCNGQELLFEEGHHYAAFSNEKELLEKLDFYLSHDEEREGIAAAGLAEIRSNHRLEHRIGQLLRDVAEAPDPAAPIRFMSQEKVYRQYGWLYESWRMPDPGLKLVGEVRRAGRSWVPLLGPALRSVLRAAFR